GEDAAMRAALNNARDITVSDDMTVEQAGRFTNIGNKGADIYNIVDTVDKLASGVSVISGARDLTSSSEFATASQAKDIYDARGDSGTLTFNVRDSADNLLSADNQGALNAAVNIVATSTSVSAASAQKLIDFTNSGYTKIGGL